MDRLKELKLALYLHYIDRCKSKLDYSNFMRILGCFALAISKECYEDFVSLVQKSVAGNLLGASNKEIVAMCEKLFKNKTIFCKKYGISRQNLNSRFNGLFSRDFITEDFIANLEPHYNSSEARFMVSVMIELIDCLSFDIGHKTHKLEDLDRTLEIEFWLIYSKLIDTFKNVNVVDKFLFNMSNTFDIDYSEIAQLKNNMHLIDRSYPNFKYNHKYFMQEVCTLYQEKGLSKVGISKNILGRESSLLYKGSYKDYAKSIKTEDMAWQYVPVLEWDDKGRANIKKFLDLMHGLIRYEYE